TSAAHHPLISSEFRVISPPFIVFRCQSRSSSSFSLSPSSQLMLLLTSFHHVMKSAREPRRSTMNAAEPMATSDRWMDSVAS
ncbi:hypothetical protein PMAYCL1PPCAC_26084, partial [Pristionchus mayeri]